MGRDLRPPPDLALPTYVRGSLGRRQELIVEHGFAAAELGLEWWNTELARAGLGRFYVTVDPNQRGSQRLTRGELFDLASTLPEEADDDALLNLLWHVLAWGSGTSRRMNRTRIASFAREGLAGQNLAYLRAATDHAKAGSVAEAYSLLIRRGGGRVGGLGPAFFTKYLYFVGAGNPDHPCLILDARASASLHEAGWSSLPRRRTSTGWTYSANWFTQIYVEYCGLLRRWSDQESERRGQPIVPDEIEIALFEHSGAGQG